MAKKLYCLQNGYAEPVPLPEPAEHYRFSPLPDGDCLVSLTNAARDDSLFRIRPKEGTFQCTPLALDPKYSACSLCNVNGENALIVLNSVFGIYHLADSSIQELPFAFESFYRPSRVAGIDDAGDVYAISCEKIEYLAPGSTMAEELLNGQDYFFGATGNTFEQLIPLKDRLFAVISGTTLLRYRYDAAAVPPSSDTITVFSMHDDFVIRRTVAALQLTRPGLCVVYRIGEEELGDGLTKEDLIKNLNTELLAGTGPDLVILDDLSHMDSYLESEVFTDLTGRIDTNGLYPNLLEAGRYGDGLYAVPTGVVFPAVASPYNDIESRRNALPPETAAQWLPNDTFPAKKTVKQLLTQSQIQAKRNLRQELSLKNHFKPIYLPAPTIENSFEALYGAALTDLPDLPDLPDGPAASEAVKNFLQLLSWMQPGSGIFNDDTYSLMNAVFLSDVLSLRYHKTPAFSMYRHILPLSSFDGKNGGYPHTMAAIPQKSKKIQNAVIFLNTMLSDMVQNDLFYAGDLSAFVDDKTFYRAFSKSGCVPVRENCLLESARYQTSAFPNTQNSDIAKIMKELHDAVSQLNTPVYLDVERAQLFYETACAYLTGELTPDEAAEKITASYSQEDTLSALEREK